MERRRTWELRSVRLPSACLALLAALCVWGPAPAPAAATEWNARLLPQPPESGNGHETYDVSCLADDECVAVGGNWSMEVHTRVTLVERWDGASWSPVPTPNPPGLDDGWQFERYAVLSGVSCTSPSACVAVGRVKGETDLMQPLAEHWNGSAWTITAVPLPDEATAGSLEGVSCSASDECVAVGEFTDASGARLTLALRWDGEEWTVQPTPSPEDAPLSRLLDVSCVSATACTAVGFYGPPFDEEQTLALRWDGEEWTMQTTHNPPGNEASNRLTGVSCPGASSCVAVGMHLERIGTKYISTPLAEHWNGVAWSVQTPPSPAGNDGSSLADVSCVDASSCTAVGDYWTFTGTGSFAEVLGVRWDGGTWSMLDMPGLPDPPGWWHDRWLHGISCATADRCVAVGDSLSAPDGGLSPRRAFAEHEIEAAPPPPPPPPPPVDPEDGEQPKPPGGGAPPQGGAPQPPAGNPQPPGNAPSPAQGGARPPLPVEFAIRRLRARPGGRLVMLLRASTAGRFTVSAVAVDRDAVSPRGLLIRRVRYGAGSVEATGGVGARAIVKPTRAARRALRAGHRLRVGITVAFTSTGGEPVEKRRVLLLTPPR